MQTLRPYQQAACDRIRAAVRLGHRRVLIVSPTGSGKTTIASSIIEHAVAKGSRVWFVAHRKELIDQAYDRVTDQGLSAGVVQADHPLWAPGKQLQICCIPSLRNRLRDNLIPNDARIIVIDEAHRSMADQYAKIVAACPQAIVLGLTATPVRKDGRGLGDLYSTLVEVEKTSKLIADGWLMEPTVYSAPQSIDLTGLRVSGGDYVESQLGDLMSKSVLVGNVSAEIDRLVGKGKRTVVFAASIKHSNLLADSIRAIGFRVAHLDHETPKDQRKKILADLRDGQLDAVVNCMILTEGWDLPHLDAVAIARPTKSVALYLQMVGRVLRTSPGKERALILDHGLLVQTHGWPTMDREWTLDKGVEKKKSEDIAIKQCPKCGCMMQRSESVCPECGHEFSPESRKPPKEIEAQLEEMQRDRAQDEYRQQATLNVHRWVAESLSKGHKRDAIGFPSTVNYRFRAITGRWLTEEEKLLALMKAGGAA